MTFFTRLCRFVDWDLSRTGIVRSGDISLLIALAIVVLPIPFLDFPYRGTDVAAIAAAIGIALVWLAFVVWRGWRIARAAGVRGDRQYDRQGKYDLPAEYADSESATRASRRRRLKKADRP